MKLYQSCRYPRFIHDNIIKNLTENWGSNRWKETTSAIPHTWWSNPRKYIQILRLEWRSLCWVLELRFLSCFSLLASNFVTFDWMIWLRYVLIIFLGLNRIKSDDLGLKRRNFGFKWSGKGSKKMGKVFDRPIDDSDWQFVICPRPRHWVRHQGLFESPLLKGE